MGKIKKVAKYFILSAITIVGLNSCFLSDLHLKEYLRPVRKLLNKERSYWTDKIEYKGETGSEIVYYKNGRPALERFFDEKGLLTTITYLGRDGRALRTDSLVYAGGEIIGGYYYSEPNHKLQLRFLSYKQQGQLSQRSWYGALNELLSREFFLFDRSGNRRMRMIFDGNDSLLYTESYTRGSDELELQNTYSIFGELISQTIYEPGKSPYRYDFKSGGKVTRISELYPGGNPKWSSDLFYNSKGLIERSNFSVDGRFLFTHLGDIELFQESLRSWKHPASPSQVQHIRKFSHTDPFVEEIVGEQPDSKIIEYRLPRSKAVFLRSLFDENNLPVRDSIFSSGHGSHPVSVRQFSDKGFVAHEVTYDLSGKPKWLHKWFRDDRERVIREEVIALPDTFSAAVSRFYDSFSLPAFSERFASPDSFDGTWVFYHGGGINKTLFYNNQFDLSESWLLRPAGDTTQHSTFENVDYIRVESKYGLNDTLKSQLRFTDDGLLSWELFFDGQKRIIKEVHRKKDGSIYREVSYNHAERSITSTTYAPLNVGSTGQFKGDLTSRVVSKLNNQGQSIQVISYNSSGEADWEKRNAYRSGKLLKSAQLDPQGKPVFISDYTHNDMGQVLTETALDKDGGLVHTIENQYNDENQLIWKTFSSTLSGTVSANRLYYDDLGRVQRDEIIQDKRFLEAIEYEYFPEFYLRMATHYTPEREIIRKEAENYFGNNVFTSSPSEDDKGNSK
ncbi:MAG: hypothetical protein HQ506_04825 [Candidatus Marinimicrobia bacterium]|nr:hypothetical protein [Candidatus Neomarinimicrobiota bacterium]